MIDEKLERLIQKYGIYEAIGGKRCHVHSQRPWHWILWAIGIIRLAWILNSELRKVENGKIMLCSNSKKLVQVIWPLLFPRNKCKICVFVSKAWTQGESFHGVAVKESFEFDHNHIDAVVLLDLTPGLRASFLKSNFKGKIIDTCSLVFEHHLGKYFPNRFLEEHYADICIARWFCEHADSLSLRQIWHKRLIAHYLRIRDFVNTEREICSYIDARYDDSEVFQCFWNEVNALLIDIKDCMGKRKQRDVIIHWLDAMEKKEFLDMKWLGNPNNGIFFHRAYTTMDHTTTVMRSIFTGKNVKSGNLVEMEKCGKSNILFLRNALKNINRYFVVFSTNAKKVVDATFLHDTCYEVASDIPVSLSLWNSLNIILCSQEPYICLLHCMETHFPYNSGGNALGFFYREKEIPDKSSISYASRAKNSRVYLDQQLEWYHSFFMNAVSIYMSDHGHEDDISEQNVNVPLKILGPDILSCDEYRLFSYRDMYKLIECLLDNEDIKICFTNYAIVDIIDPYAKAYANKIKNVAWNDFLYVARKVKKDELKKYIQTTKIVTSAGEYYTINILGEEGYYRDKECKINLANNIDYADRIEELRKIAGKFSNPWKKKQHVAIEFYEYLGIEEKDILTQCY